MLTFQLLHNAIKDHGNHTFTYKNVGDQEQPYTWNDLQKDYLTIANSLTKITSKSHPVVAILSRTRLEWNVLDFAIQAINGITVGLYPNDRDSILKENLSTCQPDLIVVENYQELKRIQSIDPDWGWIKPVIILDAPFKSAPPIYHFNTLLNERIDNHEQHAIENQMMNQDHSRIASFIFTSGTSGSPKATALSIGNLLHSAATYHDHYPVNQSDSTILYLPFSHVFSRVMFYASVLWGQQHHYVSDMDTLSTELKRLSPSVFLAVPRLLEKAKVAIDVQAKSQGKIKHALYKLAIKVGKRVNIQSRPPYILVLLHSFLDKLVLQKIRLGFGKRIRFMGVGGGKLSQTIAEYFWSIGIPVYEGYASTESGGLGIFNHPESCKLGYIGQVTGQLEYRIDPTGELQIRSPSVAMGYFSNNKVTPFPEWLSTGDIVEEDKNGFLKVIDRKKDIMVTAYGKNIAPSWIESQFTNSSLIEDIVICGDNKPYISALIVPSALIVENNDKYELIQNEINRINQQLSRHEQIKAFSLIPEFDVQDATMTATFKKRRSAILSRHQPLIDSMYQTQETYSLASAQ